MPIFIGCLFLMGAYTRESMQEVVIGAYFHGVLILCGCLFLRFYGSYTEAMLLLAPLLLLWLAPPDSEIHL